MKFLIGAFALLCLLVLPIIVHSWGHDGHLTVCKIAQGRLSKDAKKAVNHLLPKHAKGDLSSECSWADKIKFRYQWSRSLHYSDTPDKVCNYQYKRDCKDEHKVMGRCVVGAISNYTKQLHDYGNKKSKKHHNLTEALLFLSHFIGDIHQPLHVGFKGDKGGNTIFVRWFKKNTTLHHVWDSNIIETAKKRLYNSNIKTFIKAIQANITKKWGKQVKKWEKCGRNQKTCPSMYANGAIRAACKWAYKGVSNGSVIQDDYFRSRLPIVYKRLALAGVRLAATLNRIFD